MAIYAIGDVQGCYNELSRLLDRLNVDPATDELWFVGDLVNRGPQSAAVLELIMSLDKITTVTLGNHDLHLLALAHGRPPSAADEQLTALLKHEKADDFVHWLRHRPLAHYRPELNTLMVHAGIIPPWDPLQTVKLAREVENVLRGRECGAFLNNMYGRQPDLWARDLRSDDRLRFIVNCLTRIRYCDANGRLDFDNKGPPGQQPAGWMPWFDLPARGTASVRIVFGHWASMGLLQTDKLMCIDTGCVWGRSLTAVRLDGPAQTISVEADKRA
jgi:bis(5'-nucleosyl)-tetraphosphatase (symmetrical)